MSPAARPAACEADRRRDAWHTRRDAAGLVRPVVVRGAAIVIAESGKGRHRLRGQGRNVARRERRQMLGKGGCRRSHRIQVRVGRGIGDDVTDRYRERLVNLVRHLVARHELPAGRVPGDDDGPQVGERNRAAPAGGGSRRSRRTRSPWRLSLRHRLSSVPARRTSSSSRGRRAHQRTRRCSTRTGRDDDRIVERGAKEGGGKGVKEVVVGVASGAVDHYHRSRDVGHFWHRAGSCGTPASAPGPTPRSPTRCRRPLP